MVAKCANPSCDQQFRYLHRGRLFLVDQPRFMPETEVEFHDGIQRSEYFWLCERCCQTMTITSDKSGHAVIASSGTLRGCSGSRCAHLRAHRFRGIALGLLQDLSTLSVAVRTRPRHYYLRSGGVAVRGTLRRSSPVISKCLHKQLLDANDWTHAGRMLVMDPQACRSRLIDFTRRLVTVFCVLAVLPGDPALFATAAAQTEQAADVKIPSDQLDSLVAPIALYPDPMLSQVLVASTYPLEIIQLQQWLGQHKNLKDKALADAVKKQDWDPSVQALAALPDVVKQMSENIKWTTDLGNAFLAQQNDVMDAVQRMRSKAKDKGNLKSSEQQKVETKVIEKKEVIVIEQSSPDVVYVPSYNPTVVYGAPVYPYPPIAYPPPGYYAAGMAISFGIGVAMGAAWGGGWGWGCGWGGNNNVTINNNNNFVRNSNRNTNISNRTGNSNWQHNPKHRGGTPYSNRDTANRFGGSARGDSMAQRRDNSRQNGQRGGGLQQAGDRGSIGDRDRGGSVGDRGGSVGDRDRGGSVSDRDRGGSAGNRDGAGNRQPGSSDRGGNRNPSAGNTAANRGGGDRVGNRSTSSGGGSRNSSAFGGGSGGFSGSNARASSSRGSSSFSGSRGGGGGGRRGGGGGGRRR